MLTAQSGPVRSSAVALATSVSASAASCEYSLIAALPCLAVLRFAASFLGPSTLHLFVSWGKSQGYFDRRELTDKFERQQRIYSKVRLGHYKGMKATSSRNLSVKEQAATSARQHPFQPIGCFFYLSEPS
jgi:hypothetical protein